MTFTVEVKNATKSYSGARALNDVSVNFAGGRIHSLVGENGAGKSTLSKVITGVVQPDSGQLIVNGQSVHLSSTAAANAIGITMVHQELSVIGSLSVAENVLIGHEPTQGGLIARGELADKAAIYLKRVGLDVDPTISAAKLTTAQQQLVEIARALALQAAMVILDEPTSSLGPEDASRLLGLMRELRDQGTALVLVSHDLAEVMEISDDITVLRDGTVVADDVVSAFDEPKLITYMVGHEVERQESRPAPPRSGEPALSVNRLEAPGVKNVSLQVWPGEILGIGGLVGSGRSEALAAVYGDTKATGGEVRLFGQAFNPSSPHRAIAKGVGLVPESRKDQGLHLGLSIAHNIELADLDALSSGPFVDRSKGAKLVAKYAERLRIKMSSASAPVSSLSGGNQQKVVLAKILATEPKVLLLDEPTRGIDVGAKEEVSRLIRELAESGLAIVMVSSVIEELLHVCDRIVVMREGSTVGEVSAATASEQDVLTLAFTGEAEAA